MIAAAIPGPAFNVRPELDLVKAALLYGDRVTVLSPLTTMLLRTEGLERFNQRQLLELQRRIAQTLLPPDQLPGFEQALEQVDQILANPRRSFSEQRLLAALHERLGPAQREMFEIVRNVNIEAGIDQLTRARREGLVKIENADPGDEMDLLVSSVASAHLSESGQQQDNPHTDRVLETFVDKLRKHLSRGKEYLVFDEPTASLTEAAIREGLFIPATGPAGRCAQAMTASRLIGKLPTFPNATVDEVLDIRSYLAPSLTQFRSAMVTISKSFTSAPWESSFEDELHDAWVETVNPAIESIEASVRDDHSLLNLAADYAGALNTAWPGLAILGAGVLGHMHTMQTVGETLSGAAPLLQVIRDRHTAHSTVRMQPFYFLYRAERALR